MKKILFGILSMILIVCVIVSKPLVSVHASDGFEDFTSNSYILIDKCSGEVIVEKNSTERLPVASICKLMTSLITLEKLEQGVINLDDEVIASAYAASMEGSQAFLDEGCKYKVFDLLKSVVVASANDSSVALSEMISGNEKEFVKLMNQKANELGMNDTVYENSTGLSTINQYSTAYDTSIILREISKYDTYNEFSNIWMDTFVHPSGRITELVNTNRLIKYYANTVNGKTGYTDEAGYCLASTASNDELTLISVVLGCDNAAQRFSESIELYNYGFANYENKSVLYKNQALENIVKVKGGKTREVKVGAKNDYSILTKKGEDSNVSVKYDIPSKIKAPVLIGDVVGKCYIIKNGKVVGEEDIVTLENVEKQGYKDIVEKVAQDWKFIPSHS